MTNLGRHVVLFCSRNIWIKDSILTKLQAFVSPAVFVSLVTEPPHKGLRCNQLPCVSLENINAVSHSADSVTFI